MQQKIMSTTYRLVAAKEISFSIVIFQLSNGHADGEKSCPSVATGPICLPIYQLIQVLWKFYYSKATLIYE